MDSDLFMDVAELAVLLGLAPETVRWYSTQMPERVPPRMKGLKKPMWSRKVVMRWIEARDGSATLTQPLPVPLERPVRVVRTGRPRRPSL